MATIDEGAILPEEAPIEPTLPVEPEVPAEAAEPAGSTFDLTIEDVPELSDLRVGDTIMMVVDNISEDGRYTLMASPEPAGEELVLDEEVPQGELGLSGQEAVLSELTT